jgi:hypothetical protein
MSTSDYPWRDRLVLAVHSAIVLSLALFYWAERTGTSATRDPPIAISSLVLPAGIVFWASQALLLLALAGMLRLRHARTRGQASTSPKDLWILSGLMTVLVLIDIARFQEQYRSHLTLDMVCITVVSLVVVWLFYRRQESPVQNTILIASWIVALALTRSTLSSVFERIDFAAASLHTQAYIVLNMALFAVLALSPILCTHHGIRNLVRNRLGPHVLSRAWFFATLSVLAGTALIWYLILPHKPFRDQLIARGALIVLLPSLVVVVLSLLESRAPAESRVRLHLNTPSFLACLGVIGGAYLVLGYRIAANWIIDSEMDVLSYLTIARSYSEGNPVVRGCWSPLISWLLAPLLAAGIEPYPAHRTLAVLLGLVWILTTSLLARNLGLSRGMRLFLAATLACIVPGSAYGLGTVDLLGAVVLSLYFIIVTSERFLKQPYRYGALAGLLACLAYFAKYYNLPFFLAHLTLTAVLYAIRGSSRKQVLKGFVAGLSVCLIVASAWILPLSSRYHRFTVMTTGGINHATVGPSMQGSPCLESGLCPEPEDVLFPWEDPQGIYYRDFGWPPFGSIELFKHQISLIRENIWDWSINTLSRLGVAPPLTLLALGVAILLSWGNPSERFRYSWLFLSIVLYASGYMLFHDSHLRYYLAIVPLLLIAFYIIVERLVQRLPARPLLWRDRAIAAALILVVFGASLSMARSDLLRYLLSTSTELRCLETDSPAFGPYLQAPIAGTDWRINFIAFFTRQRTIGVLDASGSLSEQVATLRASGVRSVVVSDESGLTDQLEEAFHFMALTRVSLCGDAYTILRSPAWDSGSP